MFQAPNPPFSVQLLGIPDGVAGTMATVRKMRALVNESKRSPEIIQAAVSAIFHRPQFNDVAECEAIFSSVQRTIRYVRDVLHVETLSDPRMTLQRRVGDCDDKATLFAAMCEAVGYPTRFVLGGFTSPTYEHVWTQVFCADTWVDADTTLPGPFGTAAPDPLSLWFEKV